MARPKKDALKVARKTRKDGTITEYYYDRVTGVFLANDRETAIRRRPFLCPTSAQAEDTSAPEGSLGWLINRYKGNTLYTARSPGTRRLYDGYLAQINKKFGDLPIRSIRPKMIAAIRDSLAATPAKANQTLALFRILLGFAERELEYIPSNPASRPNRLPPPKRDQVWSESDIDEFMGAAPPNMRLAMGLLLHTVQRPSDVLAMDITRIKEKQDRLYISLRQQKTNVWVDVPIHGKLEPLIRDRLSNAVVRQRVGTDGRVFEEEVKLLVPSPEGHIWGRRNFSRAWDKVTLKIWFRQAKRLFADGYTKDEVREKLMESRRQRRDLRRTGIVRMAEGGATAPQIAAVSGHSVDTTQKILDVYLPRRSEIALGAILAWESQDDATRRVKETVLTTDKFSEKAKENIEEFQGALVGAAGFEPTTPSPPE